jgi:hypothetical protein
MNQDRVHRLAMLQVRNEFPDATEEELAGYADELVADWNQQAAFDRFYAGEPEDTPCLGSCDLGSGEGRYHGVIG